MNLSDELLRLQTIFIDTAPIIYYIEAHPQFGPLAREVVNSFSSGKLLALSSVITLAEVLPKPVENGNVELAQKFSTFLKNGKNIRLLEITASVAELAGNLRGRYPSLKALDAIQIAVSISAGADAFVTNDIGLKKIDELNVIVLKEYL
jgi:predicted nucleic acid-binding protein